MKKEDLSFRPELLRKSISYCAKEDCSAKEQCLHYLAFDNDEDLLAGYFINPRKVKGNAECPEFLSNEVQKVGRGFRRALAQIPYGKIQQVRSRMQGLLNCCYSRYYKYASGKVPLKLEQAKAVQKFFVSYGLEPDKVFDTYEETYILD